ncbi:MAG: 50S ribosomal protein L6 [Myxococcales bacterium]|nr:50S ribosomal protein L6 [Myxococcales bacterium]
MSRIGKKPVVIPKGVTVNIKDGLMTVKGPKGELARPFPVDVAASTEGDKLVLTRTGESRTERTNHGMARAHLANMVKGVSDGWTRELEINGVGYRAEVKGDVLNLVLGYSHPIDYKLPKGVGAKVDKNRIILSGADKDQLGQSASELRKLRKPEPYKGKGVKYVEEVIRRKAGKSGAS